MKLRYLLCCVLLSACSESADPNPWDLTEKNNTNNSGLIVFFEVTGADNQLYCLCDVGICPRVEETITLSPGVYRNVVEWNGTNWTGPFDFGNPYGHLFTPGDATLTVTAAYLDASGEQRYIASRMSIQIL